MRAIMSREVNGQSINVFFERRRRHRPRRVGQRGVTKQLGGGRRNAGDDIGGRSGHQAAHRADGGCDNDQLRRSLQDNHLRVIIAVE